MFTRRECSRAQSLLWDFAQGVLSEPDRERVERHLRRCRRCAGDVADYRHSARCLEAGRSQRIPFAEGSWTAVHQRIVQQRSGAVAVSPVRKLALAGAATALVVGLSAALLSDSHRTATVRERPQPHNASAPKVTNRGADAVAPQVVASLPAVSLDERANPPLRLSSKSGDASGHAQAPPTGSPLRQVGDDLDYINAGTDPASWTMIPPDEIARLKARLDRVLQGGDDFVDVPFPRIAAADRPSLASAVAAYEQEKKVVDPRLTRNVTLAVKGISFTDLCRELTGRTSVRMVATRTVADEKITVFCKDQPVREVMRQITRLFGYAWSRSGEESGYRYELTQSLRARLTEEELRNRDLNAAMLALDEAIRKPPPAAAARDRDIDPRRLPPQERAALERRQDHQRWAGAIGLYQRLSPLELSALRSGQTVELSTEGAQPESRIPDDLRRSLLQAHGVFPTYAPDGQFVNEGGIPFADLPSAGVSITFSIEHREPGQLSLRVEPDFSVVQNGQRVPVGGSVSVEIAAAQPPAAEKPDNAAANRLLGRQPAFREPATWSPEWGCPVLKKHGAPALEPERPFTTMEALIADSDLPPMPHVGSADVWEAIHRETGLPIIADYYTRLYPVAPFVTRGKPRFEGLCKAGDALGVRWKKEGDFIACRSATFVWDKLQEVPNRLLDRWRARREQNGEISLIDLLEMATLSDLQLNSVSSGQAIQHCQGLEEWRLLARSHNSTRGFGAGFQLLLRALGQMPPGAREQALRASGLALAELPPQHQAEMVRALQQWNYQPLRLADSRVRLEFVPAGRYVWYAPHEGLTTEQYFALPVVSGKTPEAALQAAQRVHPTAEARNIHRTRGVLTLFLNYDGRLTSQGKPR